MQKFLSYAQEWEDLILFDALGGEDRMDGIFYIDVGANSPLELSVTKALYDRGASGINIEPLEEEYKKLKQDRPRDINLCCAAGAEKGELLLYQMGTGSTVDSEVAGKAQATCRTVSVPVFRLTDVCEGHLPAGQEIHFCKIDVEGFEKQVLQGIDFSKIRPHVFVMESTEPGTDVPSFEKWESTLLSNDYELAYSYGINRYYVDKGQPELLNNFIGVDNLEKKYELYKPVPHNIQGALIAHRSLGMREWLSMCSNCMRYLFVALRNSVAYRLKKRF